MGDASGRDRTVGRRSNGHDWQARYHRRTLIESCQLCYTHAQTHTHAVIQKYNRHIHPYLCTFCSMNLKINYKTLHSGPSA